MAGRPSNMAFSEDNARQLLAYGVMPVLSGIGFYASFYQAIENGLFKHLGDIALGRTHELPGSKHKVIRRWTGIQSIDNYLAFYIAFFLPPPRGYPAMKLQNQHFMLQFTAMWSLIQLEHHRMQDSWLKQSCLLVLGFGIQTFGAAFAVPLFCVVHLLASSSDLAISGSVATTIQASSVLTIAVPLMTSVFARSSTTKQIWLVVWQVFYLFGAIIDSLPWPALPFGASVYTFAERLSTVSHLTIVAITLISKIAPGLLKNYSHLSFVNMFWPRLALRKDGDMMEARQHFMRADEAYTSVSIVLWAMACYVLALPSTSTTIPSLVKLVLKVTLRAALTGPAGVAAWLLRERDLVLRP